MSVVSVGNAVHLGVEDYLAWLGDRPEIGAALLYVESIEDHDERLAALDAYLIDTSEALSSLPHLAISEDQARRIRSGNPIILRGRDAPLPAPEAYCTMSGDLVAIGAIEEGEFRPKRVFA